MERQLHSSVYQKTAKVFLLPLQNIKGISEWALNIHVSNGPSLLPSIELLFAEVCDLKEIFVGGGFLLLHDITVNELCLTPRETKRQNMKQLASQINFTSVL